MEKQNLTQQKPHSPIKKVRGYGVGNTVEENSSILSLLRLH